MVKRGYKPILYSKKAEVNDPGSNMPVGMVAVMIVTFLLFIAVIVAILHIFLKNGPA